MKKEFDMKQQRELLSLLRKALNGMQEFNAMWENQISAPLRSKDKKAA